MWGSSGGSVMTLPALGGHLWAPGTGNLPSVAHTTRQASQEWRGKLWDEAAKALLE